MRLSKQQASRLQSSVVSKAPSGEAISLSFRVLGNEMSLLRSNLKVAATTITYTVARAIAYCAVDLLAKAQPRVPIAPPEDDGGRLRKSGTVSFMFGWGNAAGYAVDIAKGNMDGSINVDMGKMRGRLSRSRKIERIDAIIHYFRESDKDGSNVALFTHENLLPHEARSAKKPRDGKFYATTPGTGPKYLAIPFLQSVDDYATILRNAVYKNSIRNISRISSTIKRYRGRHTVDLLKLHMNKVQTLGYYR